MSSAVVAVVALAALFLPTRARVHAEDTDLTLPIRMRAFAVNMSNIATGTSGIVEIRLTSWSSADERHRVITTMIEQGQDALLKLLFDLPPKGRLRFPNWTGPDPNNLRLGWDVRYATVAPEPDGGHRIVIALDRYMTFQEISNQPRTVDYPFTLIQIRLNRNGEGEGKMAYATKITFDKDNNNVELENFSTEPVRLTTITTEKG
jgi:hypothetical protein